MKKLLFQKVICIILSVTTMFGLFAFSAAAATSEGRTYASNRDTASTLEEMEALVGISSYEEYLREYGDAQTDVSGMSKIDIDVTKPTSGSNGVIVSESEVCQDAM